jgi:hypothetical protein
VEHVAGVDVHVADRRRLALDFEDVDLTDAGLVVQISEDQDRSGEAGRVDRSAVRVRPVDLPGADTAACVDAAGVEHGPDFRSSTRHGRITDRRLSDEVRMAWHAKEVVRSIYDHHDPGLALEVVTRLGHDLQDRECPPELRQFGRTIVRWRERIAAWHRSHVSNGPTETANNLITRVKRVAFGFRRFTS